MSDPVPPTTPPPPPENEPVASAPRISAINEPLSRPLRYWKRRARVGLVITLAGFLTFLLGARPNMFGLDRSPVIGFIQISVFLVGLGIICVGGYVALTALWGDAPTSIAADIGSRLVATGYVIAVFAGMADIFGFGSQPLPKLPFFGPWQARGVEVGQVLIGLGLLMLLPLRRGSPRARRLGTPPQ